MVILGLIAAIMIVFGVLFVFNSIIYGVGAETGGAMGVNTSEVYNESQAAYVTTVQTGGTVASILPWFGILMILIGAFGLGYLLDFGGRFRKGGL